MPTLTPNQTIRGHAYSYGYDPKNLYARAECSCGWTGRNRDAATTVPADQCKRDHADHLSEETK